MAYNPFIPACYQDFITSQELCSNPPKSGLYLESLSGVSAAMLANSSNSNNKNATHHLQDRVTSALRRAESLIKQAITEQGFVFRGKGDLQSFCGFSNQYHPAIGANKPGIEIKKTSQNGAYNSFLVEKLMLKSATGGNHILQLINPNGDVVQALTVELQANQSIIASVNWNLKFGYGCSYRIVWASPNAQPAKGSCCGDTFGCCGSASPKSQNNNPWYKVVGWNGQKEESQTYGIGIKGRILCDMENLSCALLPEIKQAVLYLTGVELADAALSPQRTNSTSSNKSEWWEMKKNEWLDEAKEIIKVAVYSNLESIAQSDDFCIYRPMRFQPYVASFSGNKSVAIREFQANVMEAQEAYRRAVLSPITEAYHELAEEYREISYLGVYGSNTMYWGFEFL